MRRRRVGNSELYVGVVSLGTWAFGGRAFGPVDERDALRTIFRALDLGINLLDTAPIYGSGRAEEILGKALEGTRHEVVIATKCGPVEVRPGLVRLDLTPKGIEEQLDQSLRRLRTDYVDLLQIHWADKASDIAQAIDTLMHMVRKGKVRYVGVSNFDLEQLKVSVEAGDIVSLQSEYNLFKRGVEKEILPFCAEKSIGFLAYSPLAKGILSGKYAPGRKLAETDVRLRDKDYKGDKLTKRLSCVQELARIARREGVSVAQLAIAWVVNRPHVTSAIIGAKSPTQLVEDARAAELELDRDTVATLEKATIEAASGT